VGMTIHANVMRPMTEVVEMAWEAGHGTTRRVVILGRIVFWRMPVTSTAEKSRWFVRPARI
jgi:hypothetical protein